jgi:diguanylate cyclase (GGDEF)-like protein
MRRDPTRAPAVLVGAAAATTDRALMARSLAYLFGAGAMLALATSAIPEVQDNDIGAIFASQVLYAVAALAVLAILLVSFERLPNWAFQLILGMGTVLITVAIYLADEPGGPYTMFYLWVVVYAAYFFTRWETIAQVVLVAIAYAFVLAEQDAGNDVSRWLITLGTLVVAAVLISLLKRHVDALVSRLADTASTDPLTGILNRRGFREYFELEIERAKRSGRPLSVVACDLDHFKAVNDQFGHDAGDAALISLADTLTLTSRRIDTAGRMGGEEFAVLLPNSDARGAYIYAERLRAEVRHTYGDTPFDLTVSIGIASYPSHGETMEELLRCADEALYAAKRLGRDRSVVYSSSVGSHGSSPENVAPPPSVV